MIVYYNSIANGTDPKKFSQRIPTGCDRVLEDQCSEKLAFEERPEARQLLDLVGQGKVAVLVIPNTGVLGNDAKMLMHHFITHRIAVVFTQQT